MTENDAWLIVLGNWYVYFLITVALSLVCAFVGEALVWVGAIALDKGSTLSGSGEPGSATDDEDP